MSKRGRCPLWSETQQLYNFCRAPDVTVYTPPPVASNGMPNGVGSRSAPLCLNGLPIEEKLLNRKFKKGNVTKQLQPQPMWVASEHGRKVYLTNRGAVDAWIRDYRAREDRRGTWERQHPAYTVTVLLSPPPAPPPTPLTPVHDDVLSHSRGLTSILEAATVSVLTPQRGLNVSEVVAPPLTQGPNIVCRPDMFEDLSPTKPCQCGCGA
jgi:hypothetical protein